MRKLSYLSLIGFAGVLMLLGGLMFQSWFGGEVSEAIAAEALGSKIANPFTPPMPGHLFYKAGDRITFLHFKTPKGQAISDKDKLLFMGDMIKGRFCAQDQPDGGKTGFVHFHQLHKHAEAKHPHGGKGGEEGYWLRHIAVRTIDMNMMGKDMHFEPGILMNFMPTPPPSC